LSVEKVALKGIKLGNKAGKSTDPAAETGDIPPPMDNSVSPMPEAPLAMMEVEKTPCSTPIIDVPPPPDK
jgi:hypothetical protein